MKKPPQMKQEHQLGILELVMLRAIVNSPEHQEYLANAVAEALSSGQDVIVNAYGAIQRRYLVDGDAPALFFQEVFHHIRWEPILYAILADVLKDSPSLQ